MARRRSTAFIGLVVLMTAGWFNLDASTNFVLADENHPLLHTTSAATSPDAASNLGTTETLHFEPVTLPPVGEVTDIAIDPNDPNWIWLVTDAGGALVSSDGGATWRKAQDRNQDYLLHGKFVAVSPSDGKTVVTDSDQGGKFSGIAYTRDQGQTWRGIALGDVRGPGDVYDAAFDSTDPQTVYAVKGGDIFRVDLGNDRATSITGSTNGAVFRTIVINPQNRRQIWVGGQTSRGGFDALLSLGRSGGEGGPFAAKTKLYRSDDEGQTWSELEAAIGSIGQLVFDPQDQTVLYAATSRGVFRSADAGVTWAELADPGFPTTGVESLTLAQDGSLLLAGTRRGAWTSRDRGSTWKTVSLPDSAREQFVDSVAIDPKTPTRLYLGTTNGLFHSEDQGQTTTKFEGLYNYDVLMLAIDPYDPRRIFTGTGCARGIHRTDDLGQTWRWGGGNDFTREFLTGLDNHYQMDIDIATADPNVVWNTTAQGVYKSIDGGLTWENIDHEVTRVPMAEPAHLPWWHFHGLGIHPTDPKIVIVGNGTGGLANVPGPSETFVIRTEDGGQTWEKIVLSKEILSSIQDVVFDPFDPKTVYVPTHTESWGQFESARQQAQGLFKSTDGGKTYTRLEHGLANLEMSAFAVSNQTPSLLLTMGHSEAGHGEGDHGSVGQSERAVLEISKNGGEHWEMQELPINASQVSSHNGFVLDPTDDRRIFVATSQGILMTTDQGATWTLARHGLPEENFGIPTFLTIDRSGSMLYLVTNQPTGPAIWQAALRDPVVVQNPPVARIEKSEAEQFGDTAKSSNVFAGLHDLSSTVKQFFWIAGILLGGLLATVFEASLVTLHRRRIERRRAKTVRGPVSPSD